jgi:uroporphyrinogen decarboxylase
MNAPSKPLLRALEGEVVWPPPMWLMRQAGRYLPEYREVRAQVPDFIALCTTPELAADVTLQPVRRFRFDAAILFSDILILPWALGHGLAFKEGEGPVLPPLRDAKGVAALRPKRVAEATAPIMETVRLVRAGLKSEGLGQTALIGFAGGPFTVACYMVEGGGSRDFAATRTMAYREPALFARLLDVLTDATVTYLCAQVEAGAEALMLFDSWAGIVSPALFRECVIKPTQRIIHQVRRLYPSIPLIGFPRLGGAMLGEYGAIGLNGVGIDTSMKLGLAHQLLPEHVAIQGNLDPMALLAGGAALSDEVRAILRRQRGRPFIFNLGHGIVPQTPTAHVADLVGLVRAG